MRERCRQEKCYGCTKWISHSEDLCPLKKFLLLYKDGGGGPWTSHRAGGGGELGVGGGKEKGRGGNFEWYYL